MYADPTGLLKCLDVVGILLGLLTETDQVTHIAIIVVCSVIITVFTPLGLYVYGLK